MEDVMTFLETNYLWVIIIAAVLVITLIGYIADKKGFGKPKSKDDKKDNDKEIEIKQDVVQIPDVQETINNSEEVSRDDNQDYVEELKDEYKEENVEIAQNEDLKEENSNISDEEQVERISYDSFENLEPEENVTDLDESYINDEIENSINEDQLDEDMNLENKDNEELIDLLKQENVPEKIEVFDAEPTETLNIDNDFNRLLNDVDIDDDPIKYELPKIESIDSTDLTDDEDIWKF